MINSMNKSTENHQNNRIRDLSALLANADLVGMDRVRVIMALEKEYAMIAQNELEKQAAFEKGKAEGVKKGEAEGRAKGRAIGMAKGREIGMAKGRAIGMAKGMAKGEAEGRAEVKAMVITRLYRNGMTTNQIASLTNYAVEEIESII